MTGSRQMQRSITNDRCRGVLLMTGSRFMLSQLDLFTQFIKVFSKAEDEISFVISLILDFIIQMSYLTVNENSRIL